MSSPLDFQTESPAFESHQGHICYFFLLLFFFFFLRTIVLKCSNSRECRVFFCANQDRNFVIELNKWWTTLPKWSRIGPSCRNEGATSYVCRFQMHSLSATINKPAPIAQLVEWPLRGTGGHVFDPGLRHTKVVKNGIAAPRLALRFTG